MPNFDIHDGSNDSLNKFVFNRLRDSDFLKIFLRRPVQSRESVKSSDTYSTLHVESDVSGLIQAD